MRGCGEPDRAVGDGVQHAFERGFVCAERRCGEFQIARYADRIGSQHTEPRRMLRILRERELERPEQPAREARETAPSPERGWRHARVQQRCRYALRAEFAEHVGPELRLDPEREVGPPVLEKPAYPGRPVHRIILVGRARRQPSRQQGGCGPGNRRREHRRIRAHRHEPVDQRKDGGGLADAGPMEPHQRAVGTRCAGDAAPFAQSRRVFPAAPPPVGDIDRQDGRQKAGRRPIGKVHHEAAVDGNGSCPQSRSARSVRPSSASLRRGSASPSETGSASPNR